MAHKATGSGKKITEQRFKMIKAVLNEMPRHTQGATSIYKALGVSVSAASEIRRSADYSEFRARSRARSAEQRAKREKTEASPAGVSTGTYLPPNYEVVTETTELQSIKQMLLEQQSRLDSIQNELAIISMYREAELIAVADSLDIEISDDEMPDTLFQKIKERIVRR